MDETLKREVTAKRRHRLRPPFARLLWLWTLIGAPIALALLLKGLLHTSQANADTTFLALQDLPILPICLLIVGALAWPGAPLELKVATVRRPGLWIAASAAACFLVGAIGVRVVFRSYDFSLDEYLANFDARIFGRGHPMAPVAPAWRPYLQALQPIFILHPPDNAFWASAYLPVNAAIRALAGRADAATLVNPLWSAVAIVATYFVGRQLWPGRPGTALGAATLLATSSQLLITSMTAYAMPAHLALNMVWLWLFLRGGGVRHAAAIGVAALATGLHQLAFHPLFAAPFVLDLWLCKRWRLAAAYTAAYAAIVLFWISYASLAFDAVGVAPQAASAAGAGLFLQRVFDQLRALNGNAAGEMVASLFRFATWQNVLTAPLAVAGASAAWRAKGPLRAMLLGVVLTLVVVTIVMPTQMYGWGYRYLHGLLGTICLLAANGWLQLTGSLAETERRAARGGFAAACVASLVVLLPLRAWQAYAFVRPFATANALVQGAAEPIVVVDNQNPWFDMGAVVRNDPFLRRAPKVMLLPALTPLQVRELCARYPVAIFDGQQAAAIGVQTYAVPDYASDSGQKAEMRKLGCGRPLASPRPAPP